MELSSSLFAGYKLLKYFLYPLSWIVAPLILATALVLLPYSPRRFRWIRFLLFSSTILVLLCATPIPGRTLLAVLEGWYPPFQPISSSSKFDAIVVLSGGINLPGSLRPQTDLSGESRERTTCGADLFLQGLAPKLLLVGGDASAFGHGQPEAPEMKRLARRLGVADHAIQLKTALGIHTKMR